LGLLPSSSMAACTDCRPARGGRRRLRALLEPPAAWAGKGGRAPSSGWLRSATTPPFLVFLRTVKALPLSRDSKQASSRPSLSAAPHSTRRLCGRRWTSAVRSMAQAVPAARSGNSTSSTSSRRRLRRAWRARSTSRPYTFLRTVARSSRVSSKPTLAPASEAAAPRSFTPTGLARLSQASSA
jgi:hypothetical protein